MPPKSLPPVPRTIIKPRHDSPSDKQYHCPNTIEALSKAVTGLLISQGKLRVRVDHLETENSKLKIDIAFLNHRIKNQKSMDDSA